MDELPSSQFRKVYASLRRPTVVTVSGHQIGTYVPISSAIDARHVDAIRPGEPAAPAFASFRPVPKPGKRS